MLRKNTILASFQSMKPAIIYREVSMQWRGIVSISNIPRLTAPNCISHSWVLYILCSLEILWMWNSCVKKPCTNTFPGLLKFLYLTFFSFHFAILLKDTTIENDIILMVHKQHRCMLLTCKAIKLTSLH